MRKMKVVVVDDSAFMRKLISEMINSHHKFEVVAKLKNGKELIDNIDKYNPDIVTLDLEMPIMDGLSTLKELKRKGNECPVIVLSSLSTEGSKLTMECLAEGATDFIAKPSGSISLDINRIQELLLEKMDGITSKKKIHNTKRVLKTHNGIYKNKIKAIVMGASTGGPKALQKVLTSIDIKVGVPIFVVQHMPQGFTKAFAERLNTICYLNVVEAYDGMSVEKDTIYIAKGGFHMTVGKDGRIHLTEEPTMWGVRPAVDKLFSSAVNYYKGDLLSVVLTGMGRDGAKGTELVKDAGGITIAEDEISCTIYGMPKAAYETGKVDEVLLLEHIGDRLKKIVKGETI